MDFKQQVENERPTIKEIDECNRIKKEQEQEQKQKIVMMLEELIKARIINAARNSPQNGLEFSFTDGFVFTQDGDLLFRLMINEKCIPRSLRNYNISFELTPLGQNVFCELSKILKIDNIYLEPLKVSFYMKEYSPESELKIHFSEYPKETFDIPISFKDRFILARGGAARISVRYTYNPS